jgi:hypothetical protein
MPEGLLAFPKEEVGMLEPTPAVIASLVAARNALFDHRAQVWAQLVPIENDIAAVSGMLARYGYADAVSPHAEPVAAAPVAGAVQPPSISIPADVSEAVAKLIVEVGPMQATRRYCEWLVKNGRVAIPASVRDLFEQFTPSLRQHFNPDDASAIETLRSQIKAWVSRNETIMTYEGGMVGIKSEAPTLEKRTA